MYIPQQTIVANAQNVIDLTEAFFWLGSVPTDTEVKLYGCDVVLIGCDGDRPNQKYDLQKRYALWENDLLSTIIILRIGGPEAEAELRTYYKKGLSPEEQVMPRKTLIGVMASTVVVVVSLFLLMYATGGHQAAESAVEFFKKI